MLERYSKYYHLHLKNSGQGSYSPCPSLNVIGQCIQYLPWDFKMELQRHAPAPSILTQ
jgi:hypothetical protein